MFDFGPALLEIAARTAIIYLALLVGLRLAGKREVGQMTPFDLVVLLTISNAVQNAMTGPNTSMTGGLVAAGTLLLINLGVSKLAARNQRVGRMIKGEATILVHRGRLVKEHLSREGISVDELNAALREHGVPSIEDVRLAVLEIDGSISVLKNDDMPATSQPHHRFKFIKKHP